MGILARGIAALYHKAIDNAVKQQAVEEVFVGQLDEIIPVFGSFIVQADNNDHPRIGGHLYLVPPGMGAWDVLATVWWF